MAEVNMAGSNFRIVDSRNAYVKSYIAGCAVASPGQAVFLSGSCLVGLAHDETGACYQFAGMSLNAASIGGVVDILHEGECYNTAVSALEVWSPLFVGACPGNLATSGSNVYITAGKVWCSNRGTGGASPVRTVFIQNSITASWA